VRSLDHRRLWLVTTNDNLRAQRFYERAGFRLVEVREGEIERSRRLKPEIPLLGEGGVPIRDELEYEFSM
jgi:ribosomal protein S18 acetylase RimI-like enzyme